MYHCFGCNEQGNLFNFISKVKDISTTEAYKEICEKYNIEFEKETEPLNKPRNDKYDVSIYSKEKGFLCL